MLTSVLRCTWFLTLAALAVVPGSGGAAHTRVAGGAVAQRMTALDGVVVWVSGSGSQSTLMQRAADGTVTPVRGAPAASYRSIDLGHDARGDLVLTYLSCAPAKRCDAWSDDLLGHRARFKHLAATRCKLTTAPARWRDRVAYGQICTRKHPVASETTHAARRSGLFVRRGGGAAQRLRLPYPAVHVYGYAVDVRWVDLRGDNVGAVIVNPDSYVFYTAYTQRVDGTHLRASDTGYGGEDSPGPSVSVKGLSLGAGGLLWTLDASSPFAGAPGAAIVRKGLACAGGRSSCAHGDACTQAEDTSMGAAQAMAVDGDRIYLYVPGTGIVAHAFVPDPAFEC
jgi:hypothetical protein